LAVLLSHLLTPQRIRVPLTAADKAAVIRELIDVVAEGSPTSAEDLLQAVEEREQVLSTGIGHGVAIPHGRSGRLTDLRMSAGVAPHPIEFGSLDGAPVRLVFLLVGPESEAGAHVKALSRITRLVRQPLVRERLIGAATGEEFHRYLREAEGV
jgi:mannitol/fructose-specific phosphotransferase system IIA component (Ntr-type)